MNKNLYTICANAPKNYLYLPKELRRDNKYDYNYELDDSYNNSHSKSVKLITKENSIILDVGCSTGIVGKYLINRKKCIVDGIELDAKAGKKAMEKGYRKVLNIDIDTRQGLKQLSELEQYDYILCLDVLEHIKNINELFLQLFLLLKSSGTMIISLPNISHIDIIYHLLKGEFNYSPCGILDNTHVRFFTKKSFLQWCHQILKDNNLKFKVEVVDNIPFNSLPIYSEIDTKYRDVIMKQIIKLSKKFLHKEAEEVLFTGQYIFEVTKIN